MIDEYFTGQGEVFVAVRDPNTGVVGGFTPLGNCSALTLKLGLHPAQYATGGTAKGRSKHTGDPPQYTIGMENLSVANLALALHGSSAVITPSTVVGEAITVFVGQMTPLAHLAVSNVVVKNAAGTTTYAENVDYTVNYGAGSIFVLGGAIANGAVLTVNYSYGKYQMVGGYTTAPQFIWLRFEGLNSWDSNSPVVVDIFRSKLFPIDNTDLIGDALIRLDVRGRIFRDRSQPVAGLQDSQLIRIRKAPTNQ